MTKRKTKAKPIPQYYHKNLRVLVTLESDLFRVRVLDTYCSFTCESLQTVRGMLRVALLHHIQVGIKAGHVPLTYDWEVADDPEGSYDHDEAAKLYVMAIKARNFLDGKAMDTVTYRGVTCGYRATIAIH